MFDCLPMDAKLGGRLGETLGKLNSTLVGTSSGLSENVALGKGWVKHLGGSMGL